MNYFDPTPEQEAAYLAWTETRPAHVKAVALRFRPWGLYRLKSSNHRVTIYSFGEASDGTVTLTVNVTGQFNLLTFDRQVFGVPPDDLEPCDVPGSTDVVGTLLTEEHDIQQFISGLRQQMTKKES